MNQKKPGMLPQKLIHKMINPNDLIISEEDANKSRKGLSLSKLCEHNHKLKYPIMVDENLNVLCGIRGVLAARIMGLNEIEVIVMSDNEANPLSNKAGR